MINHFFHNAKVLINLQKNGSVSQFNKSVSVGEINPSLHFMFQLISFRYFLIKIYTFEEIFFIKIIHR